MTVSTRLDTVHVFRDSLGEWRWRHRAPAGRTISESRHGHRTLTDAKHDIRAHLGYHGYTLMTGTE